MTAQPDPAQADPPEAEPVDTLKPVLSPAFWVMMALAAVCLLAALVIGVSPRLLAGRNGHAATPLASAAREAKRAPPMVPGPP